MAPAVSLEQDELHLRKRGHAGNADIYEGRAGGVPVIVKDFSRKSWLVRAIVGPLSIRRERRVYRALEGVDGVARLFEDDAGRLVVARIDGAALSAAAPGSVPAATFERLRALVAALHERGIVHLDLNHRGNILLTADGAPWLIDHASALDLRWLGPLGRALARRIGFFDRAAVAKWKAQLCPEPLSEQEQRDLARLMRWKRLWILNPK